MAPGWCAALRPGVYPYVCTSLFVVSFILCVVSFTRVNWVHHRYGSVGLWQSYANYESFPGDRYTTHHSTAHASGPVFLELTRMFMCVALVSAIVGLFGFLCIKREENPKTLRGRLKNSTQELALFFGGVFQLIAATIFTAGYHEYYAGTKNLQDVSLGIGLRLACASGGLSIVFSVVTAAVKDRGLNEHFREKLDVCTRRRRRESGGTSGSSDQTLPSTRITHALNQHSLEEGRGRGGAGNESNGGEEVKENALQRAITRRDNININCNNSIISPAFKTAVIGGSIRNECNAQEGESSQGTDNMESADGNDHRLENSRPSDDSNTYTNTAHFQPSTRVVDSLQQTEVEEIPADLEPPSYEEVVGNDVYYYYALWE